SNDGSARADAFRAWMCMPCAHHLHPRRVAHPPALLSWAPTAAGGRRFLGWPRPERASRAMDVHVRCAEPRLTAARTRRSRGGGRDSTLRGRLTHPADGTVVAWSTT